MAHALAEVPLSSKTTIALDAMGGDNAPGVVVAGANIARERMPYVEFLFFGREEEIAPLLSKMDRLQAVSRIVHCEDVVRRIFRAMATIGGIAVRDG